MRPSPPLRPGRAGGWRATPLLLLALAGPGCASGPADSANPEARFRSLESRLLRAEPIALGFDITATGAVEAAVRGRLVLGPGDAALLRAEGEFAGRPVDLVLRTPGDSTMVFGDVDGPAVAPQPASLREALAIGLTRMGVLHNIARLTGGAPPDHAEGGVADWVVVDGFRSADEGEGAAIGFDIAVSGRPAGDATVVLEPDGLPVTRRQVVHFPDGDMHVVERYTPLDG